MDYFRHARFPSLQTKTFSYASGNVWLYGKPHTHTQSNEQVHSLFHADVLQISPTDNNGTHGSMNHILRQPYHQPELPAERSRPTQCLLMSLDPEDNLGCSCPALVGIVTLILQSSVTLNWRGQLRGTEEKRQCLIHKSSLSFAKTCL